VMPEECRSASVLVSVAMDVEDETPESCLEQMPCKLTENKVSKRLLLLPVVTFQYFLSIWLILHEKVKVS